MDLQKVNIAKSSEEGYEFEITFPDTGERLGGFITVRGTHSPVVREYSRKKFNDMQTKAAMARKRGKDPEEMTLDEAEDMAIEAAVVRTISWRNIKDGGVEVPFSKERAAQLYREYPWIREQVAKESDMVINFRPE